MTSVVRFTPRPKVESKLNLEAYIALQKEQLPPSLGTWDDDIWNATDRLEKRRKSKGGTRLYFRSWKESRGNSTRVLGESMPSPFKEFAKAYVTEIVVERNVGLAVVGRNIKVCQALAAATETLRGKACVTRVDSEVLDYTATLISERFAPTSVWAYGRVLEKLSDRINHAGLAPWRAPWKNPFKEHSSPRNDRVYTKLDVKLSERLPKMGAVIALGEIHSDSNEDNDKVVTCFAALALVAPERAGEILTLPLDCIRSMDHGNTTRHGMAWRPLKGGLPKTNWAVNEDVERVMLDSIDWIKERGRKARTAAAWYAANPGQLYLPEGFEHLRDTGSVTLWEASQILGRDTVPRACHKQGAFGFNAAIGRISGDEMIGRVDSDNKSSWVSTYALSELEKHAIGMLPVSFPVLDGEAALHYADALWCLPYNILRPDGVTLEYVPDTLDTVQLNNQLGSNPGSTIFSRNNKLDEHGDLYAITSHQFRHLLNTLARSKHLSHELTAFWSGRKRVTQNAWYDHVPQEAYIEGYLGLNDELPEFGMIGPLDDKVTSVARGHSLSRKDALHYELGSTHKTRYGICRHDYSLTPCPKDKDCVNCGEHVFTKGDAGQIQEAQDQVALFTKSVERAQAALAEGRQGAQRWLDLNKPKLARWEMALAMLTDPEIADGTVFTLPAPEHSQSKAGLAESIRQADVLASDQGLLNEMGML